MTDLSTAIANLREFAHERNDDEQVSDGKLTGADLRLILAHCEVTRTMEGMIVPPQLKLDDSVLGEPE